VSTSPTGHFGSSPVLNIVGTTKKTYLRFNVAAALPSGVTSSDVAKATLTVWVNAVGVPGSFAVKRVTSAWTEESITANTAPSLGNVELAAVPVTTRYDFVTADPTAWSRRG
jgi:hypothetical protein